MHVPRSLFPLLCGLALCAAQPPLHAALDRLFPPGAVVDVTQPPYNARPGDGQDDTAAIQRAITSAVNTGRVLYFPAGVYDIHSTLAAKNAEGIWRAHLTLQGQSREKTVLRLADNAPGFGDPASPKAVLVTASHWEKGDSPDGGGNKAFRNNIFDLTVDTGTGNPGAVGIDYAVSNFGAIENVAVRSGDGRGVAGISMRRRIPGPGLLKNVSVQGFETGIDLADGQYGITLENAELRSQGKRALRVARNLLHARRIHSVNRVPALELTGRDSFAVLLDSTLEGGSPDSRAIECEGNLLLRGIATAGYAPAAVRIRGQEVPGPLYPGHASAAVPGAPADPVPTLLPVEETPSYWNANLADWEPIGPRKPGEPDDTAAIQRALDSGKSTVYFPNTRAYFLSDTVAVRGKVRQILGLGSEISLGAAREPFGDPARPRPLFRIDPGEAPAVFFENLFFNAQYPGEVLFENNTPATVVIRHCGGWVGAEGHRRTYRSTAQATGRLFVEDAFLPGWEFTNQNVWARQFNPENPDGDGIAPQVANRGGRLWILGFKTEGPAPYLATSGGAVTELLGAYNYVSATNAPAVPAGAVPYSVADSTAALTFATDNFRASDYAVYIRTTHNGQTRDYTAADLPPRNGHRGDRSLAVPLLRIAPTAP